MKKWLTGVLGIREGEIALVRAFFFFFFGIGMFYTVGAIVGDTLFLSNIPPKKIPTMLPWVYAGVALVSFGVTIVYDAIQHRVSRLVAIVGTQLVLSVSVLVARFVLALDTSWVYFALVIWLEVCALLSITLFFSFAGDYFSSRDARRLYGIIAGGMALGTVVAGNTSSIIVGYIGTRNLLYVGAAFLAMNAFICYRIYRFSVPVPIEIEARNVSDDHVSLKAIFSRPYVRLLAVMISMALIMTVVVDYQMKWIASTMDEEQLARFFGTFWGAVGIAQLLFQFLLVPKLLRNLGIINCLMILPTLIAMAASALILGSAFNYFGIGLLAFSAAANFLRITLTETLELPSREMLFLPLPTRIRMRAQPFMNGALAAWARGIGGMLMLLLFSLGVDVSRLSFVAVLSTMLLVFSLLRLRPKYRETLAATLRAHETDAANLEEVVQSPTVVPMLEDLLQSDDPEIVKFTLDLVKTRSADELQMTLEELLKSSDSSVRTAALECLQNDSSELFLPHIRHALRSSDPVVKRAAILALCRLRGREALEEIDSLAVGEDRVTRNSAMFGLAQHFGDHGTMRVQTIIDEQLESEDKEARIEAAQLIGGIGRPEYTDLLERLLDDRETDVRIAAIEATASTMDLSLVPNLLGAMAIPELRPVAIRALSEMPKEGASSVIERFSSGNCPELDRPELLGVISRIGGQEAVHTLYGEILNPKRDLVFRSEAANALRVLRVKEGLYNLKLKGWRSAISEISRSLDLINRAVMQVGRTYPFVSFVFRDHACLHIRLLVNLYGLKYDPRQIGHILFNLFADAEPTRLRALELLDELMPRRIAPKIVALIHPSIEEAVPVGRSLGKQTYYELQRADSWSRVITAYYLARNETDHTNRLGIELNAEEMALYERLDTVAFLKRAPLFRRLLAHFLAEHVDISEWVEMEAEQVLFEQGDAGDALYVISSGETAIVVDGEEVVRLGSGECIGEMALLDKRLRSATVVATTHTRLLRIGEEKFRQMLTSRSVVAKALLRTIAARIHQTQTGASISESPDDSRQRATTTIASAAPNLQRIIPIVSFLGRVELFAGLPLHNLTRLAGIVEDVVYYRQEELFRQGDLGDSLYLIKSGKVDIVVDGNRVATLGENAVLGEMALISDLNRSATARVAEDAHLLRLWSEDFNLLLDTEPEVSLALLNTLVDRLRRVTTKKMSLPLQGSSTDEKK